MKSFNGKTSLINSNTLSILTTWSSEILPGNDVAKFVEQLHLNSFRTLPFTIEYSLFHLHS